MSTLPSSRSSSLGLIWGAVGVIAFSFTVIFTRVAVEQLDPLFVGAGRAVVAALVAGAALVITRSIRPTRRQWARLSVVAGGVVVGFPLFTSFALTAAPASHGAVVIALLPAATAVAAVLRTRERPGIAFWLIASVGALTAVTFALLGGAGATFFHLSDLLLFAAVIAAAVGYAEGALLARELGAWQTISWALVVASPAMLALTLAAASAMPVQADAGHWAAFGYLAIVSMFAGFIAWYRGLAIGPITRVSQRQLAQPAFSLLWAALFLGENLTPLTIAGGIAVVGCAALAATARRRAPANKTPLRPRLVDLRPREPQRRGAVTAREPLDRSAPTVPSAGRSGGVRAHGG